MIEEWKTGGATRQTGGNWAGRFILPEDLAAWYVINGRYLEQGQMVTIGDALLKWDGSAFKIIDATFASTAEADAWVAKVGAPIAANSTATIAGTLVRYGGVGVGWLPMGVDESLTLAELLATTGSTGATAKCLDPMFGPMGAMFDWAQSLGKWVPRNARIYGSGVGTVYTASAGDINTDVQVGSLVIPESLVFPGIEIRSMMSIIRSNTGAAGACNGRLYFPAGPFTIVQITGPGIASEGRGQGFMYMPSSKTALLRSGSPASPHSGFGLNASASPQKIGNAYTMVASLNAQTAGMIQELSCLYAELSYGG